MKFKNKKIGIKLSIIASIFGITATGTSLIIQKNASLENNYSNNTLQVKNNLVNQEQLNDLNHPINKATEANSIQYALNYNDASYKKFDYSPVNIKQWKQLYSTVPVLQDKYIAINFNELNDRGTSLELLISEIATTNDQGNLYSDKKPYVIKIDFGKLAYSCPGPEGKQGKGAFTKAYYSGGIFDERNKCFIVCISLYDKKIQAWTPVLFRFDPNNLQNPTVFENSRIRGKGTEEEGYKTNGFLVSWYYYSAWDENKVIRFMSYKSDTPFDFNIVPFFKTFDDTDDDTETGAAFFQIYRYDPTYKFASIFSSTRNARYGSQNQAINTFICNDYDPSISFPGPEYSKYSLNIWNTTFAITKKQEYVYYPRWFKTATSHSYRHFANPILSIRPILTKWNDINQHSVLAILSKQTILDEDIDECGGSKSEAEKLLKNNVSISLFNNIGWFLGGDYNKPVLITNSKNNKTEALKIEPTNKSFANQSRYIYLDKVKTPTSKETGTEVWSDLLMSYYNGNGYGSNDQQSYSCVINRVVSIQQEYPMEINMSNTEYAKFIVPSEIYSWLLNDPNWNKFDIGAMYIVNEDKNKRLFFAGSSHQAIKLGLNQRTNVDFFGSIDFSFFLDCNPKNIPANGEFSFQNIIKKQLFETKQAWISFTNSDLSKPVDLINYQKGVCFAPPILPFKTSKGQHINLAYLHKENKTNNSVKSASLVPIKSYIGMARNDVKEKPIGPLDNTISIKDITPDLLNKALDDLNKNNELYFTNIYANNINPNSSNQEKIKQFYTDWTKEKWFSSIKTEILPISEQNIPNTLKFRIKINNQSTNSDSAILDNANAIFLNSQYQDEPDIFYLTGFGKYDDTAIILNELLVPGMTQTNAEAYTKEEALKIINENKHKIFFNLPHEAKISISEYNSDLNANLNGEIILKITINNYYKDNKHYKDGPIQEFNFKLTGFKKINANTTLTKNSISWTDPYFSNLVPNAKPDEKGLFVFKNSKGFVEDWSKDFNDGKISIRAEQLKQYMNSSIDKFFTDTYHTTVSNVIIDSVKNNVAKATITFSGINNQQVVQNMQATFSINLRSKPKPNDPLFKDFQDYMQNKIDQNNNLLPDDKTLNSWVSDYLNRKKILRNIPDVCIPNNGKGSFTSDNITTGSIENTQVPIKVSFKTKGSDILEELELPLINLTFKVTRANPRIAATSPINEYTTFLIIKKWNQDNNSQEINIIKQWMNDHITSIFNVIPNNATITQINSIKKTNNVDELVFTVTLSNAYTSKGIVADKQFSFTINKFSTQVNETTLKEITINYTDPLFKQIFSNDKGFAVDWNNDNTNQKNQLLAYMNSHLSDFFESFPNANDFEGVKVNNLEFTINEQTSSCNVHVIYSGYNDTGWSDAIQGNITINLRHFNDNILSQVQTNIQNWIDQNHHFPNDDELKQIISDFLNQHKSDLPNVYIPSNGNGSFSNNDILIVNQPTKDTTTGEVWFRSGDIVTTNQTKSLTFPTIENNVIITKFNEYQIINISGLKDYPIDDVLEIINNKIDPMFNSILDQVRQQAKGANGYLENYEYGNLNDINITNAKLDNVTGNIIIDVNVDNARGIDGLISLKDKKLMIDKDCFAFGLENLLNIKTINWDSELFNAIFGDNDRGFYEDWSNPEITNLSEKETMLMNYMNQTNNIALFFSNTNHIKKPKVNHVTIDLNKTRSTGFASATLTVTINYSGYKNGKYIDNNIDNIKLVLRRLAKRPTKEYIDTKKIDIDPASHNIYDKIQEAIAVNIAKNEGTLPTDQELTEIIANVINNNQMDVPYSWLPNNGKNIPVITANDIFIDPNLIVQRETETLDLNYIFTNGSIGIKKSATETNLFPSLGTFAYKKIISRQQTTPWWIICIEICSGVLLLLIILVIILIFYFKSS